jgi:uncharacterized membrane protein
MRVLPTPHSLLFHSLHNLRTFIPKQQLHMTSSMLVAHQCVTISHYSVSSFSCPHLLALRVLLSTLICIMSFVATFVTSDKAEIFSTILLWTIYSIMSRLVMVETNILSTILLLPSIDYITPLLTLFAFLLIRAVP